jgi:hypothetical protein
VCIHSSMLRRALTTTTTTTRGGAGLRARADGADNIPSTSSSSRADDEARASANAVATAKYIASSSLSSSNDAFDALPDDVVAYALSFCDAKTLKTLTRTTRRFAATGACAVVERGAALGVARRMRDEGCEGDAVLKAREGESWMDVLAFVEARGEARAVGVVASVSASENATTVVTSSGKSYVWGDISASVKNEGGLFARTVHAAAGYACVARVGFENTFHIDALAQSTSGVGSPGNFHQSSTMQDELRKILTPPSTHAFGDARVVQIALGRLHVLARTHDGKVFSWGGDAAGQLGHGTHRVGEAIARISLGRSPTASTVRRKQRMHGGGGSPPLHQNFLLLDSFGSGPRQISALEEEEVVKVCASRYSSIVLTKSGKVFSFGDNREGLLGLGDSIVRCSPTCVATVKEHVADVCLGAHHALAVTDNGLVYSWGSNRRKQLGFVGERLSTWPALVELETQDVVRCAAGGAHSLCLTADGIVYSFGANDDHQCGQQHLPSMRSDDECFPRVVPGISTRIVEIAAGSKHSIAVDSSGTVYGFGSNEKGQLGKIERAVVSMAHVCT